MPKAETIYCHSFLSLPYSFMGICPQHTRRAKQALSRNHGRKQNRIGFCASRGLRRLLPYGHTSWNDNQAIRLSSRCYNWPASVRSWCFAVYTRWQVAVIPVLPIFALCHWLRTDMPRDRSQSLRNSTWQQGWSRTPHQPCPIIQWSWMDCWPTCRRIASILRQQQ